MRTDEIKIITLGPEGTFSHQAAAKVKSLMHEKGKKLEINFSSTINSLFKIPEDESIIIVAPLENSEAGTIGKTVDQLAKNPESNIQIVLELEQLIEHHLAGFGSIAEVETVYAHPQAQFQSEEFLVKHLPDAEIQHTTSNSKSAVLLAETKSSKYAAIVPFIASSIHSLPIIHSNIQNSNNNTTRFVVLTKNNSLKESFNQFTKSKLSIIVDPQMNYPGLLFEILEVFAEENINLSRIESRPSKRKLGDYVSVSYTHLTLPTN